MNKKSTALSFILIITIITASITIIVTKNSNTNIDVKVNDYYALSEFNFSGDFNEFYKDSYTWYKSIENKNGVHIINTAYYSDETLNIWKENNVYNAIPDKDFWYFTVSPSYLKQMNIRLSDDEMNRAKNGTRLYLVPDTLSESETEQITSFLKEDALKNAETSTIETAFTKNREIEIISYSPTDSYFTFPSDKGETITDEAPIIYVCTAANMKFYESESLISTGVDSYIKFENEKIMKKYTDNSNLKRYSLKFSKLSKIYEKAAKNGIVDKGINKILD